MKKQKVLVYDDSSLGTESRGTSLSSIKHSLSSFSKLLDKRKYYTGRINPGELLASKWLKDTKLLILPGGRDKPYTKVLNGKGNAIIKDFVLKGGSLLGICAGAYYLGKRVEFNPSNPNYAVNENRELGFYPSTIKGPALGDYNPSSDLGVRAAETTREETKDTFKVYYNGGGYFVPLNTKINRQNIKIVATYKKNQKPAILKLSLGEGKILLSGVHFEYNPNEFFPKTKKEKSVQEELLKDEEKRLDFLKEIINYLGVLK